MRSAVAISGKSKLASCDVDVPLDVASLNEQFMAIGLWLITCEIPHRARVVAHPSSRVLRVSFPDRHSARAFRRAFDQHDFRSQGPALPCPATFATAWHETSAPPIRSSDRKVESGFRADAGLVQFSGSGSGATAGAFSTLPSGAKWEPWQGQSQHSSNEFHFRSQPRCVQAADRSNSSPLSSR